MSVRLQFPRGGYFSFQRQFVVGGAALNLSGGTLVAYLKASPDDADSAALATLTIAAVDAAQGTVLISLTAAQTADLPLGVAAHWEARATVGGATYICESTHGPVVLTPLEYLAGAELDDTGITETLVPDETGLTLVPQYQPLDTELTALAGLTSAADTVPYFTGAGTAALAALTSYARSILAGATAAAVRTTLGLAAIAASGSASDLASGTVPDARLPAVLPALSGLNLTALNASNLGSGTVPTARLYTTAAGYNITNGAALDALGAVASNGLLARTAANTYAARTLTGPAAGLTVTNGDGAAGNPTLALANDLAALEGLAANGLAVRTATDTWTVRTITGTAGQVTVTNGDGVAGGPTLSLPTALTGINSITSTALANLVLATGTFGTSVTFASATGIPTFATGAVFTGALSGITTLGASGVVTLTNATEAGAGVGSLVTSGGIATAKALYVGSTTASTSTTTGSGIFGGGIGVAGAGWFGGDITRTGSGNVFALLDSSGTNVNRYLRLQKSAVARWDIGSSGNETGSDTGSNYLISAFNDAGAAIDVPLQINRVAGSVITLRRPTNFTDATASTSTATGSATFGGGIGVAGAGWHGGVVVSSGNTGLPTQTGAQIYLAGNDAASTNRIFYGDGSGYSLKFASRTGGVTTDRMTLTDVGTLLVSGNCAFAGAAVSASSGLVLPVGTTALSSLRIPHGAAPTSPVNGDIWTTTSGLFVRINGSTVGPLT